MKHIKRFHETEGAHLNEMSDSPDSPHQYDPNKPYPYADQYLRRIRMSGSRDDSDNYRHRLFESEDSLYRSIKKYYKTFLTNWLDNNDPDRYLEGPIDEDVFIQDCIDMFGINGSDEYNAGYDDELVRQVSRQVLIEEE